MGFLSPLRPSALMNARWRRFAPEYDRTGSGFLLGARSSTQTGQLPPGLGLILHDLENAQVFLSGFKAVARLGLGTGKAQPGLDVAGAPDQHRPPLVHRLEVLLGLPETPFWTATSGISGPGPHTGPPSTAPAATACSANSSRS